MNSTCLPKLDPPESLDVDSPAPATQDEPQAADASPFSLESFPSKARGVLQDTTSHAVTSAALQPEKGTACATVPNITVAHSPKALEQESFFATTLRTLKACKDSVLSTFCYSTTGVLAQGASLGIDTLPNPFAYSMVRSFFAGLSTFSTAKKGLRQLGSREWVMAGLVGVNNTLWIPAFMFTDLASAMVIGYSAPLLHAAYEGVTKKKVPSALTTIGLALTSAALFTIYQGGQHAGTLPVIGNAAAFGATLCLACYRIMVGESARRAQASNDESVKQSTKEKLSSLTFVSNVISFGIGALSLPFSSGGLGAKPLRTLALGALHGITGGAALHFNTRANQELNQVTTSLIGTFQVGLTPALGFLLWGSKIPEYALAAGVLTFTGSMLAIADKWRQERNNRRGAAR